MIDRKDIEWLIDSYKDEITKLHEARNKNFGIGFENAILTGKLGVYGRVVADLTDLLESEAESEKS